jgi:DNA-directed RNA polymerase
MFGVEVPDERPEISELDTSHTSSRKPQVTKNMDYSPHVKPAASLNPKSFADELAASTNSQTSLLMKQIFIEDRQHTNAVKEYVESLSKMMKGGQATGLKHIQSRILSWFEPLMRDIEAENYLIKMHIPGYDRGGVGALLDLLPVDKLAVVTINTTLNQILRQGNCGVPVRNICLTIGRLLQCELNLLKAEEKGDILTRWNKEQIKLARGNERRVHMLSRQLCELTSEEKWSSETNIHLGSILLSLLVQTAKNQYGAPCFVQAKIFLDSEKQHQDMRHATGVIQMEENIYKEILDRNLETLTPQFLPMVVPPVAWTLDRSDISGGFIRTDCQFMRTGSKIHLRSLLRSDISDVTVALDYLSTVKWAIHKRLLEVVSEAYANNDLIGELPTKHDLELPKESDFPRVVLDTEVLYTEADRKYLSRKTVPELQQLCKDNGLTKYGTTISGLITNLLMKPLTALDPNGNEYDVRAFKKTLNIVSKTNSELHSLRCDVDIKLNIAKEFMDDTVYFPCNLDFRGRVYPVPPNLNHLGSDLCRGLLLFGESKALGDNGFDWLKIHLCNLFGNNKISLNDRRNWSDENMAEILDSASDPLKGRRWWTTAESPFQALACCFEIKAAVDSGDPASYRTNLPVHQDGSCNGLQHYAALGRDAPGALAVNLITGEMDKPGDVYSAVLDIVCKKVEADRIQEDNADPKKQQIKNNAIFLEGKVNRKVIKQTVMTSVYGVTALGARDQVLARLLDIEKAELKGAPVSHDMIEQNKSAAG